MPELDDGRRGVRVPLSGQLTGAVDGVVLRERIRGAAPFQFTGWPGLTLGFGILSLRI
ncbi:hypothetical protein FHU38_003822 [Saccharomonospora amisosensis]|uniref:Uncharacterized protein n=1 Tax=Saccharomonospora amisosensis TaxID=1128677 RepID=A0A7X5ZS26_9PSEU|nr:hypothetical protein [Saccharomonospora amisosensis]